MNEVSDEGSSLRVELERAARPQRNLQGAGSRGCDVQNVTETGRRRFGREYTEQNKNKKTVWIWRFTPKELDSLTIQTRNTLEF